MAWLLPIVNAKLTIARLSLALCVVVGPRLAHAEPPPAPGQQAEALLAALSKEPQAQLAADYTRRASKALERATAASVQQQAARATLLESLALRLATSARDLLRAIALEAQANQLEAELAAAQKKAIRARALIEETLARKNRAQAHLTEVESEPSALPSSKPSKPSKPSSKVSP